MTTKTDLAAKRKAANIILVIALSVLSTASALGQAPPAGGAAAPGGPRAPRPVSPVVASNGAITFKVYAPQAKSVTVSGEFVGAGVTAPPMTRGDDGVWTGVSAPVAPGAYRYNFTVDGTATMDMANVQTSAAQAGVRSLVVVPGAAAPYQDNSAAVPHGAVSVVYYPSKFGGGQRQMHVYTPPGYETGKGLFPVLYLIHGGGDGDDSWPTVGRAGFILDNLIAAGKAKPMIVVMPDGNVDPAGQVMTGDPAKEPFVADMTQSLIPYVEKNYRVVRSADGRALAGLSMGGIQTMNVGFSNLDTFHSLGIFSSGFFPADEKIFADKMGPQLDAAKSKLKVFYMAYGQTDIAKPQAENNIKLFKEHGLTPVVEVTDRGHEWYNWRRYLVSFAPTLFR